MNGHHLILGDIADFLTGKRIVNTHDEQYRQKLARFLVDDLKYRKEDIVPRISVPVKAGGKTAVALLDFAITLSGRYSMIVKYGPGSLVTRHRLSLALSRMLADYQIPVVVVTNGEDADVLCGSSGKIMGAGFSAVPSRPELLKIIETNRFSPVSPKQREMESRIVFAFEIDDACPCDSAAGTCDLLPTLKHNADE
jgi:hypothetical protein